ncbi:hypothetical protein ACIQGZ_26740 [Streptomyces sp. NPDC092296]|uniref:hypothetical protein n=1 Tax=Streptomyces sp. NPDC092296 TaxID=3366012 RepID=UPI0037F640D0
MGALRVRAGGRGGRRAAGWAAALLLAGGAVAGCSGGGGPEALEPPAPPPGARAATLGAPDCSVPATAQRPVTEALVAGSGGAGGTVLEYRCDRTVAVPGSRAARVAGVGSCGRGSVTPDDVFSNGGLATGLLPEQLLWHVFCVDRAGQRLAVGFMELEYGTGKGGLPGVTYWVTKPF